MKLFLKIISAICLVVILFFAVIALQIYFYDESSATSTADAAIVLGAAVWGERLSPVFQERVNHALNLYRAKRIKKIIFTGGQGNADEETEAESARRFAISDGIPPEDILIEDKSTSTYENLAFAKPIAEANGIKTVLLVSDPLHLKRSVEIAKSLNLEVSPSPTPTTKYQGFTSRMKLLIHETYYYAGFLLSRTFGD
ncbi:MAG TPA: YdcF family protein [Pyrinomonadaceae bacterium]|jgi:uncharacterized SAM-binding protein YcdF (DUF218 family)|nr:YdcF family protein [Pyrinomonadaceae bacterium]